MGSGFKTFTAGSILTASDVQNYLQDQAVMVFGGTAARSSAIGTANFEEGMLTYLTDVDKLQVYTGASFVDVYPAAATNQGLTLINTTSFSGVASQSVNSVFTSTYDNYKIVCYISNFTGSDTDLRFRLRASGTDYTTGNHYIGNINGTFPSSISFSRTTSDTSGYIGRGGTSTNNTFFAELSSPQLAVNKQMTVTSFRQFASFGLNVTSSTFPTSSSYDGFSLIPVSGNISGIVSVYGYNK